MSKEKRRQEIKSSSTPQKVHLKPRGNTNSNRNSPLPSPRVEKVASYEWGLDDALIDKKRDMRGGRENLDGKSQRRQNKEQAELQQKRREARNGGKLTKQNNQKKESQMWVSHATGDGGGSQLTIGTPTNNNLNIREQPIFSNSNEAEIFTSMKENWSIDLFKTSSNQLEKDRSPPKVQNDTTELTKLSRERDLMKKQNEDLRKKVNEMEQIKMAKKKQEREKNQAQVEKFMIKIVELEQRLSTESVETQMRRNKTLRAHDKIESELGVSRRENDELRKQLEHIRQTALERTSKIKKLVNNHEGAAREYNNAEMNVRQRHQELADLKEQLDKLNAELQMKEDKFSDEMEKKKSLQALYNAKVMEEQEQVTQKSAELEQAKKEANQMSIQEAEAIQQVKSKEEEVKQRAEDLQRLEEEMQLRAEDNKQRDSVNTRTQSLILSWSQLQEEWREESKSPGLRKRLRKSQTSWRSLRPAVEYPLSPQTTKRTEEETKRFLRIVRPDGRRPTDESLPKDFVLLVVRLGSKATDEGITCSFKKDWELVTVIRASIAVWRDHFQQMQNTPRQHNWIMETDISDLGILHIKKYIRLRIVSGPSGIELKGGQLDKELRDFPQLRNNTKIILSKFIKRKSESDRVFPRSMTTSSLL